MAETAESQTELLFCMKCEKETATQPVQKICSVCGLSRRWNAFLSWTNVPFDQLERWVKGARNLVLAILALFVAFVGFQKYWPKSADTRQEAKIEPCGNKGECLTVQLQNDGTKPDMVLTFNLGVKITGRDGETLIEQPIDSYLPGEAALLDPNVAAIPAGKNWFRKIEMDPLGSYLADPAYDVDGSTCTYTVTIDTQQREDIVGTVPCW